MANAISDENVEIPLANAVFFVNVWVSLYLMKKYKNTKLFKNRGLAEKKYFIDIKNFTKNPGTGNS